MNMWNIEPVSTAVCNEREREVRETLLEKDSRPTGTCTSDLCNSTAWARTLAFLTSRFAFRSYSETINY